MISSAISLLADPPRQIQGVKGSDFRRFTIGGSDALEMQLTEICQRVADGVASIVPQSRLDAILLAGGYGRGEGGVLKTPEGERPYNDMEFYVFLRGSRLLNERRFGLRLRDLAHRLSEGVEVELKVLSFDKLRTSAPSMFYYDLVMGHRWVAGHEGLLAGTEHHRHAADIPLHEATRLLMNRCSGLLFARDLLERAEWCSDSSDFVGRNIAKAQLALGDAVLTAHGRYHWSCRERNRRLHDLTLEAPHIGKLCAYHDEGVSFKLNPVRASDARELLRYRHEDVMGHACDIFLWLESKRLSTEFSDARAYGLSNLNKCPETNPLRNVLVNAHAFGVRGLRRNVLRHPRQGILEALSLLLWTPGMAEPRIHKLLKTNMFTFPEAVARYQELWRRFN